MLPLMHILMGGASRATDYEQLTFRNAGIDLPRRVTLYDNDHVLVDHQSRKTSLLHGKDDSCLLLLPRKWFEHVLHYWTTVRPFAVLLTRILEKPGKEIDRWQRFCFVKAHGKFVRNSINKVMNGPSRTFQRLRHAIQALFRDRVVPREHEIENNFPYDTLFGHSRITGLSYGVRVFIGSDRSHGATDITGIRRCLRTYWRAIGLEREDAQDDTLSVDSSDSENESGSYNDDDDDDSDEFQVPYSPHETFQEDNDDQVSHSSPGLGQYQEDSEEDSDDQVSHSSAGLGQYQEDSEEDVDDNYESPVRHSSPTFQEDIEDAMNSENESQICQDMQDAGTSYQDNEESFDNAGTSRQDNDESFDNTETSADAINLEQNQR